MLLAGLGILDIDRLIEFREPPLRSQEGKVQGKLSDHLTRCHTVDNLSIVNIAEMSLTSGGSQMIVQVLICCECRRSIRSKFYTCDKVCIHQDTSQRSGCGLAKHQYKVCAGCYPSCDHTKQHLKKIRPYDPMDTQVVRELGHRERKRLTEDIRRLQKHQDKEDDVNDGNHNLRTVSNIVPSTVRKQIVPVGNVHASVTFGPLIIEIGARQ